MEIINSKEIFYGKIKNPVLTLGNFDGIHLGHQKIFRQLKERALEINGQSVIYTFNPHPVKVLNPKKFFPLITDFNEKVRLISEFGIDFLICADFDIEFANQPARDFVEKVLCGAIGVKEVLVGYDYRFGRGREGNSEYLKMMGKEFNFSVEIIDPVFVDGNIVSSSRIRELVQSGEMRLTAKMLGREFSVTGIIVKGKERGKKLGFPTANLLLQNELLPKEGVYTTRIELRGNIYKGMTNIGTNPTFKDKTLSIEVHIFDFNEDCYGELMKVYFVERLRDEREFPSPRDLILQLKEDEMRSREILSQGEGR
jgi:riboflavin kinase/FMN adenylyltransferase